MHWYDWHTVTERLQGRAYALTRGRSYRVILDPTTRTGVCDFTNKKILINPDLFDDVFRKMGLSGGKRDKANFLVSRAITGHEALHVLYSDAGVTAAAGAGVLKTVLNLLEDARIEKIGSETSHVSKCLFRFVNRIATSQLADFRDVSLSDAQPVLDLLLRWRLGAKIPPLDGATIWPQAKSIADRALTAPTCADVLEYAREIVKLMGLDESHTPQMGPESRDVMRRTQSEMDGERSSQPMRSPLGQTEPYQGEEDTEQGEDETVPPDGIDDEQDTGGRDGTTEEEEAGGEARADNTDVRDRETPICSEQDLKALVDETAAAASEDLQPLLPDENDVGNTTVARSTPYRGRIYSDVAATPYIQYLEQAKPIAAEITRDLRAEAPRAVSGASEHAGKFRTRYFLRDSSKSFAAERFRGISVPEMAIGLVLDRSGSMEGIIDDLKVMATSIALACENLRIAISIWALEGQVHIKRFDEHGPQVLAKIAGITPDTLTRVMPTLLDAHKDLKSGPEPLKQIVMIHDGMPATSSSGAAG